MEISDRCKVLFPRVQKEQQMADMIKQPAHYMLMDGELETKYLIKDRVGCMADNYPFVSGHSSYAYGNAIKYLMRWPTKNGVEDLRKCKESIDMLLEELL